MSDDDIKAASAALNAAPVPEDNRHMTDADGNIYSTPPTPSNNVDTAEIETIIWENVGHDTYQDNVDNIIAHVTADRNKLIKHLAFYYGLPEAEMKKVSEQIK